MVAVHSLRATRRWNAPMRARCPIATSRHLPYPQTTPNNPAVIPARMPRPMEKPCSWQRHGLACPSPSSSGSSAPNFDAPPCSATACSHFRAATPRCRRAVATQPQANHSCQKCCNTAVNHACVYMPSQMCTSRSDSSACVVTAKNKLK